MKENNNEALGFFDRQTIEQAERELGALAIAAEWGGVKLITDTDSVFREYGVPVRSFETARIAGIDGVTSEFSVRRDDLVHQAAVAIEAGYDPQRVIMPVIIGDINPVVLRNKNDIKAGPYGFLVPNRSDAEGNEGRSQCVVVTGDLLKEGYGLAMLVADCPVENVVVTEKDKPETLVAIAQTHNGWRQVADGSDIELQKVFDSEGWLDKSKYDIYVTPSAGVAYGFEMDTDYIEEAMKKRGADIYGRDRTKDIAWGISPVDPANPKPDFTELAPPREGKGYVNMALTAHINHLVSLGIDTNEKAYSESWVDSLTSPVRPSDRRANLKYGSDAPQRQYRMLAALLPIE